MYVYFIYALAVTMKKGSMQTQKLCLRELFSRMASSDDEAALWELHAQYFHRLYRFVFAFIGNKEITEEVVNDTFLDIWQSRHLLPKVLSAEVYIFICAKNRALKQLSKQNKHADVLTALHDIECVMVRTPYDILISSEMCRRINRAIRLLPPQCKLIFTLVKENGLKYREVAGLLGLSEKTVENQMSIALKKLSQSVPLSFSS